MVLGGNQIYRNDIEILDMSKKLSVCSKPINFPQEHVRGAIGAFYRGNNILCGGEQAGKICHQYSFLFHEWIKAPFALTTERTRAAGVMLSNASWVVLGGSNLNDDPLPTVEVMTDGLFMEGIMWPEAVSGHCIRNFNGSHAFVAGGEGKFGLLSTAYFLNVDNSNFHQVENPMRYPRSGHVCGFANLEKGDRFAVVAGGFEILEVELLSIHSLKWKSGPMLPHELNWAASIMNDDTMVIIGGEHIGYCSKPYLCISSNSIFKLALDENKWQPQSQTLSLPRSKHVIIELPESMNNICQESCPTCSSKKSNTHKDCSAIGLYLMFQ